MKKILLVLMILFIPIYAMANPLSLMPKRVCTDAEITAGTSIIPCVATPKQLGDTYSGATAEVSDATVGAAGDTDTTHAYSKDDIHDYVAQHDSDYDGLPDGTEAGVVTAAMLAATLDLSGKTITFGLESTDIPDYGTIAATDSGDADATWYPLIADGATGTQNAQTDSGLSFNPLTNILTASGGFQGGSSANPTFTMKDSDASAGDVNYSLDANATDTGDGTEDIDIAEKIQINGVLTTVRSIDADGSYTAGSAAMPFIVGGTQFKLPSSDADPTATAGYLRHDSTITNFTNGGIVYYNGAVIKQVIDMSTATAQACNDDYVVAYDAGADLWYCKADSTGSGSLGTNLSSSTDDILSDNGTMLIGGTGGTNNETLDYDFETTADVIAISSPTSANLRLATSMQWQFRDPAIHIESSDDGHLDLTADISIDMNGPVIFNSTATLPTTTSGDQTLTVGMVGLKTDEDLLVTHGGANGEVQSEVGLSLLQHISFPLDPAGWYDQESTYRSVPIMQIGDDFPHGFTITEWRVNYVGGDPTTELDADLICDTTPDFNTAADATVMDVLDTTAGASTADSGFDSATCANGSELYIHFGADPVDANVVIQFDLWGYAEED